MKILANLLFCALVLIGCDSPVVFGDAYPIGTEPLDRIPDQYFGVYMCESDSTLITINDKLILALEFNFFEESTDDLDNRVGCTLIDDEVYIEEIQDCIPIEYLGEDSVRGEFISVDTLFYLGAINIIKPFKSSLVLSQKAKSDEYIVSLLSMDAYGNVFYRAINESSDLDAVAEITDIKQIGVDRNNEPVYKVKPSKKEFEDLFEDENIFIVCEYLIRVNLEEFPYYIF